MPQFERELTEEEGRKLNEIWEKWLKNKPVQQIQPSDINDVTHWMPLPEPPK